MDPLAVTLRVREFDITLILYQRVTRIFIAKFRIFDRLGNRVQTMQEFFANFRPLLSLNLLKLK